MISIGYVPQISQDARKSLIFKIWRLNEPRGPFWTGRNMHKLPTTVDMRLRNLSGSPACETYYFVIPKIIAPHKFEYTECGRMRIKFGFSDSKSFISKFHYRAKNFSDSIHSPSLRKPHSRQRLPMKNNVQQGLPFASSSQCKLFDPRKRICPGLHQLLLIG